jgi:hypothetical protein
MTKQFTVPCNFGQDIFPVTFHIGSPENTHHPIGFQSDWLSKEKGGTVPQDLMNMLQKLHELALKNNADFEELCYYALISATKTSTSNSLQKLSDSDIAKYADEFFDNANDNSIQNSNNQSDLSSNISSSSQYNNDDLEKNISERIATHTQIDTQHKKGIQDNSYQNNNGFLTKSNDISNDELLLYDNQNTVSGTNFSDDDLLVGSGNSELPQSLTANEDDLLLEVDVSSVYSGDEDLLS